MMSKKITFMRKDTKLRRSEPPISVLGVQSDYKLSDDSVSEIDPANRSPTDLTELQVSKGRNQKRRASSKFIQFAKKRNSLIQISPSSLKDKNPNISSSQITANFGDGSQVMVTTKRPLGDCSKFGSNDRPKLFLSPGIGTVGKNPIRENSEPSENKEKVNFLQTGSQQDKKSSVSEVTEDQ